MKSRTARYLQDAKLLFHLPLLRNRVAAQTGTGMVDKLPPPQIA